MTITWQCSTCNEPILFGLLIVRHADVIRAASERAVSTPPHPRVDRASLVCLADIPKWEPAQWEAYHDDCDPGPDSDLDYWIDINQAATLADLLGWSAKLLCKRWLADTDWGRVLQRAVKGDRA